MNNNLIFFMSPGKCATMWFYNLFNELYSDVTVDHEFWGEKEKIAKYYLNTLKHPNILFTDSRFIKQKKKIDNSKLYIETGWTNYVSLPYWIENYNVKLVHLLRDPYEHIPSLTQAKNISSIEKQAKKQSCFVDVDFNDFKKLDKQYKVTWMWLERNKYFEFLKTKTDSFTFYYSWLKNKNFKKIKKLINFIGLDYKDDIETFCERIINKHHTPNIEIDNSKLLFKDDFLNYYRSNF